ncbi:hypothetical protein AB0H58_32420 [Nocardia neocaledoniensis]|uniref:hypothetical protein n=1 Tax=Nocardia neocaledoniensis TaxID=236511 RepID=UPI003406FC25
MPNTTTPEQAIAADIAAVSTSVVTLLDNASDPAALLAEVKILDELVFALRVRLIDAHEIDTTNLLASTREQVPAPLAGLVARSLDPDGAAA